MSSREWEQMHQTTVRSLRRRMHTLRIMYATLYIHLYSP